MAAFENWAKYSLYLPLVFKKKQRNIALEIFKGDLYLFVSKFLFFPSYLSFSTAMYVMSHGSGDSTATSGHGRSTGFVSEKGNSLCGLEQSDYETVRMMGLGKRNITFFLVRRNPSVREDVHLPQNFHHSLTTFVRSR